MESIQGISLHSFQARNDDKHVRADLRFISLKQVELTFSWPSDWPLNFNLCQKVGRRRHELWKGNCFETFIQPVGQTQYWEFNLSPSGDWNVYHFDSYRNPSPPIEDPMWTLQTFEISPGKVQSVWNCKQDLELQWRASLNCILYLNGEVTYWATYHAGTKPDFHLSESFILERTVK